MKEILKNKKVIVYSLLQLMSILITLFCGYLIDPIRKFHSNVFFAFPIVFVVFASVSMLFTCLLWKQIKCYKNLETYITVINICLSAVILTVALKIIVTINANSFMGKTGLISVVLDFCFILLIVLVSMMPYFEKLRKQKFIKKDL